MTDITELAQREKFEAWVMTQICISKSTLEGLRTSVGYRNSTLSGSDYNLMWNLWKAAGAELVEALEKAQKRISRLESRTVKLPDELSGETLLDVASRTDIVYSDDTGVLEYTNINGCFVKVTAPPDKIIIFRSSNKFIYIRLVDRVKTHEHAGIIVDFPKKL